MFSEVSAIGLTPTAICCRRFAAEIAQLQKA
jgi:hypothetical protein